MAVYVESKSSKLNIEDAIGIPAGTEASPSLYFQTNTDTGAYSSGGEFSITVNGDRKLAISENEITTTVGLVLNPSNSILPVSGSNVACYLSKSLGLGVSNWNLYSNGSAPNYFNGSVGIGTSTPSSKLEVSGVITVSAGTAAAPAIVASEDSDTGCFFPSSNIFAVSTAGVERFRIDSTGRIGITQLSNFHNLYVNRSATGNTTQIGVGSECTILSDVTNQFVGFRTNPVTSGSFNLTNIHHYQAAQFSALGAGSSVTNIYGFNATASLGGKATNTYGFYSDIASASNTWNLYVNGTAPSLFNGVVYFASGTTTSPSIAFTTDTNTGIAQIGGADTWSVVTGGVERVRVDSSGNVGINRATPTAPLTFSNTIASPSTPSKEEQTNKIRLYDDGTYQFGFGISTGSINIAANGGNLATMRFWTDSVERMRIASNGNVGIGTTTPASSLDVNGVITVSAGTAAAPAIVSPGGTSDCGIFWAGADAIAISTAGVERLRIGNTGFVGIGTSGSSSVGLRIHHAHNANNIVGVMNNLQINSSALNSYAYWTAPALLAENTAYTTHIHYIANPISSIPSGSSITNVEAGFQFGNSIQQHTVRAFVSALNSLTGYERYAFLASGSAPSLFNGVVYFAAGTAALPSIAISTDTNTGLFAPSADNLAITTGGTERLRVDSSGKILVGTTTSRSAGPAVHPAFQFEGTNAGAASFQCIAGSGQATVSPQILLARHRGGIGDSTLVQDGDTIGIIRFNGGDGTDCVSNAAQIECRIDGTPGSNDMPGRLMFSTTSDGSATATERMRIKSNGVVRFIPLSADPASAEEGDMYFNSTSKKLKVYNGTSWVDLH